MASPEELKERALVGVVERAARSAHAESLVLRGGLVVRPELSGIQRPVDDVDFLGLDPLDADSSEGALREILGAPVDDGITYDPPALEKIWEETDAPGLRAQTVAHLDGEEIPIQVDLGFGDPRVVPDREVSLEGQKTPIKAAAVEMLFVWKIHGLFERGHGRWRAKDLFDVWILGKRDDLDEAALPKSLRVAFESRGDTFTIMDRFLGGPWGTSSGSRKKWKSYVAERGDDAAPEDMQKVVMAIRQRIIPIVAAASKDWPEEG